MGLSGSVCCSESCRRSCCLLMGGQQLSGGGCDQDGGLGRGWGKIAGELGRLLVNSVLLAGGLL